jgi:hypothetical protein
LLRQHPVAKKKRGDVRLRHQMHRKPPPWKNKRAFTGSNAVNSESIPQFRKRSCRAQPRVLFHGVAADEHAAFVGENTEAWPTFGKYLY